LVQLVGDSSATAVTRIHALWSLEGLGYYDSALMQTVVKDGDADLRREAVRSLVTFQPPLEELVALLSPLTQDEHYMVKEEVLRTLKNVGYANNETIEMLVRFAKPQQKKGAENIHRFGDTYEENFQSFLAFMALEQYPTELLAYLETPTAKKLPEENLNEATKRLPKSARAQRIVTAIQNGSIALDVNTLISLAPSLNDHKIRQALQSELSTKKFVTTALEALPELSASSLHLALTPAIKTLLTSGDEADQQLAIQAIVSYQHRRLVPALVEHLREQAPEDLTSLELQALNLVADQDLIVKIIRDSEASITARTKAALRLTAIDKTRGYQELQLLLADANSKNSVLAVLKSNTYGMHYLLQAYTSKQLTSDQLTIHDKSKLLSTLSKYAQVFSKEVVRHNAEEKKVSSQKIHHIAASFDEKGGNANHGKLFSATCLACHQIGDQGVNLAPALGGYKDRDPEHLLTAIIQPNAAIEKGYELYRVIQKDGSITEGFLFNKSNYGTTIAMAGGGTVYLPKELIQREFFVSRQSNMPSFASLPEQQLRDLLAYLKTL